MTKKIKVGFYCQNEGYPNVDCRFPEKGNPGIGGTQFTEIATAYYLNQFYPDKLEILLLANLTELLPSSLKFAQVLDVVDAALTSEKQGCDIFVFRTSFLTNELIQKLDTLNVKIIARSNNYPTIFELNQMADCSKIKCHVCVGQEQLDILRDHRVFKKSTRIFDLFNPEGFIPKDIPVKKGNTVVYIGSLIPTKGFHVLARVWNNILKKKPDARLIVIGSGKVYNRNQQLGKWEVAEEDYEANYIRPFLSDENGGITKSVQFAGLLGEEKIEILQNADVGVVNPTGTSEVCPGSALEIQSCGTPVVSAAKWGLLDTVVHGRTGLLGRSDRDLVRNIVYLLDNLDVARQFGQNGINFVRDKFDHRLIIKEWLDLFIDVYHDRLPKTQPMKSNYLYEGKFLREAMRVIKNNIPLLHRVPSLVEAKSKIKEIIIFCLKWVQE